MRNSFAKKALNALQIHLLWIEPDILCIVLKGELDSSEYRELLGFTKDNLFSDQKAVLVDTKDLTFMDSSGIKFLSFLISRFGQENVAVFKASLDLKRVLSLVAFDTKLTFLNSLGELKEWRFQERRAA